MILSFRSSYKKKFWQHLSINLKFYMHLKSFKEPPQEIASKKKVSLFYKVTDVSEEKQGSVLALSLPAQGKYGDLKSKVFA